MTQIADINHWLTRRLSDLIDVCDTKAEATQGFSISHVTLTNLFWTDTVEFDDSLGGKVPGWRGLLQIEHAGQLPSIVLDVALRLIGLNPFQLFRLINASGFYMRAAEWKALAAKQLIFGVEAVTSEIA